MRVQPEVHAQTFPIAGRPIAWIRVHGGVVGSIVALIATALLALSWAAAGILVLRELVRWFAEVPGSMATRFGGWLIP